MCVLSCIAILGVSSPWAIGAFGDYQDQYGTCNAAAAGYLGGCAACMHLVLRYCRCTGSLHDSRTLSYAHTPCGSTISALYVLHISMVRSRDDSMKAVRKANMLLSSQCTVYGCQGHNVCDRYSVCRSMQTRYCMLWSNPSHFFASPYVHTFAHAFFHGSCTSPDCRLPTRVYACDQPYWICLPFMLWLILCHR